jgi:hypothetical protein
MKFPIHSSKFCLITVNFFQVLLVLIKDNYYSLGFFSFSQLIRLCKFMNENPLRVSHTFKRLIILSFLSAFIVL